MHWSHGWGGQMSLKLTAQWQEYGLFFIWLTINNMDKDMMESEKKERSCKKRKDSTINKHKSYTIVNNEYQN